VGFARKIILVETDEGLQRRIEGLLAPLGVSVISFSDRWRAFRRIKRNRDYDAVLIDEDLAGIGVLRTLFANILHDLDAKMKFMVLIDSTDDFDPRPFEDNGYANLLPKSELASRLAGELRRLLGIQARPTTASRRKRITTRRRRRELARAGVC
jgi:DNA-binding NtrC family response regulator